MSAKKLKRNSNDDKAEPLLLNDTMVELESVGSESFSAGEDFIDHLLDEMDEQKDEDENLMQQELDKTAQYTSTVFSC